MKQPTHSPLELFLKSCSQEPEHEISRLIIEHDNWCPFVRLQGPCACNRTLREATDEEWEQLTGDSNHDPILVRRKPRPSGR